MKKINEEAVQEICEGVTNSNGNVFVRLAVGALGVAAGIGAVVFIKKRRNNKLKAEDIEFDSEDN